MTPSSDEKVERYLTPAQVAHRLAVSLDTAHRILPEIPGVINIAAPMSARRMLRVPESGLAKFIKLRCR